MMSRNAPDPGRLRYQRKASAARTRCACACVSLNSVTMVASAGRISSSPPGSPPRFKASLSLVQSAKLNGHDPWAYLRDVLERLPSRPNSRIQELLPHRWQKPAA